MIDVNVCLEYAIKESKKINSGEEFVLRDLFKGYEWNRIEKSMRLRLGTLFINYVENNSDVIQISDKVKSGQKIYKKI